MVLKYISRSTALALSLAATATLNPVQAEELPEENVGLNTIFVTATRAAEKSTDVAASTGSKSGLEVELDKAVLQRDLFNSIAGVRVTQTGSTLGHMTSVRMPTNTGSYYLFLQDGIPVQSSGFFNHNGLAYTNYSTASSTEILKGAGTALYGSDSVAATINVQSVKAGTKDGFSVTPEVGSDGFKRLGITGGVAIGDNADLSISASSMQSDGWREHTAAKRDELTVQHVIDVNQHNTLKTIFSYNKSDAEMAGNIIGEAEFLNNPTSVGDVATKLSQGVELKRKFDFTRLSTEWTNDSFKDTELSTIAYYRTNRNRYTATWENNLPVNDSKTKTLGAMVKADIKAEDKLRLILGADVESTQASVLYTQEFDYVPAGWGTSVAKGTIYNYDVDYLAVAPYLHAEFNATDKLKFSAGARYDVNSYDYTNNEADGQYAASAYSRPADNNDPTFKHLSPKFDLSYALGAEQLLYARYANSFRIPQATRLYSLKTNNIAFTLDPEISDTFELGYKHESSTLGFDVSIYKMSINDTIVQRENAAKERYFVNGGETLHQGIELSLSSKLSDEFTVKATYSTAQHEYVNDVVNGNNEQAQAPKDTANIRLICSPSQVSGLTAMFEIEHVGEWWLDDANTKKYGGYDIGNLKVNYKPTDSLSFYAKVNNIGDKVYAESADIAWGNERYTPAAPRQYFTGMTYNW